MKLYFKCNILLFSVFALYKNLYTVNYILSDTKMLGSLTYKHMISVIMELVFHVILYNIKIENTFNYKHQASY